MGRVGVTTGREATPYRPNDLLSATASAWPGQSDPDRQIAQRRSGPWLPEEDVMGDDDE